VKRTSIRHGRDVRADAKARDAVSVRNTIQHFEIYGDDPPKLAEFYKKLFGWKIEAAKGYPDYWMVRTVPTDDKGVPTEPGINGGLMKRPTPEASAWMNYVTVASLDETVKKAQSIGATVMRPRSSVPKMGWFAILMDPQQNVFAIWQEDPKAG